MRRINMKTLRSLVAGCEIVLSFLVVFMFLWAVYSRVRRRGSC